MNPYLILAGVLTVAVTAVVGFLGVPGFINGAHDSAAKNDLSNITTVQESIYTYETEYADTMAELENGVAGIEFHPSADGKYALASSGDAYVVVAESKSGMFFARISGSADIGEGDTIGAALTAAGATAAWATANGITLPTSAS